MTRRESITELTHVVSSSSSSCPFSFCSIKSLSKCLGKQNYTEQLGSRALEYTALRVEAIYTLPWREQRIHGQHSSIVQGPVWKSRDSWEGTWGPSPLQASPHSYSLSVNLSHFLTCYSVSRKMAKSPGGCMPNMSVNNEYKMLLDIWEQRFFGGRFGVNWNPGNTIDLLTLYLKMTPPSAPKEDKTMHKIIGQIYFQEEKLDEQRQMGAVNLSVRSPKLVERQKVG